MGAQPQENGDTDTPAIQLTDESTLVLGDGSVLEEAASVTPLSSFGIWDFLRMVFVLAVVVALIYGVFYFIKKANTPRDDGMRFIRVLETRPLAASRHLHLVEVGTQILLVGSAENGVGLVSQVSDKETLDEIRLASSQLRPAAGSFAGILMRLLGKGRGGRPSPGMESLTDAAEGKEGSLDFMVKQKERLKKLF